MTPRLRAMEVSFIIPLYNCLELTRAMLASLQATLPAGLAHEIIFVDDGSTDGTRDWLATLAPPVRVVLNDRNLGYAGANNRGAALATGATLVLLNNDLEFTPHWLEPMLAAHRALGPRAGLVGNVQLNHATGAVDHAGMRFNAKGKPEHIRDAPAALRSFLAPVRRVEILTGACMLLAASLWRELGGFDEGFVNGCEEVDLCLRARAAGRTNAVALRSTIRHHVSASPGRNRRNEQNSHRLARKWRADLPALSARAWAWDHLRREWSGARDPADGATARAALRFALHLCPTPPVAVLAGVETALEHEFARWSRLLDSDPSGTRPSPYP